jgi:hypothetical protein
MPTANHISIFDRDPETRAWMTPSIEFPRHFAYSYERENMIMARESSRADSVIVSIDGTEVSMMATLGLEEAIALRKELNKAINAVRKGSK